MKKINKKGHKFIVFFVLISLVLLFVTCGEQEEKTSGSLVPSGPSQPSGPSEPITNNSYIVIYDKNAVDATGTMSNSIFTVGVSGKLQINNFVRNNYCFLGWSRSSTSTTAEYTDGQFINLSTTETSITLYAVWHETYTVVVTAGSTLEGKFTWITNNVESYTTYIIEINSDYVSNIYFLDYELKKYITIQLKGNGSISNSSGRLFTVKSGVTLILDGNITLSGGNNYPSPSYSLIIVSEGGYLIMNDGKISGNTTYGYYVYGYGIYGSYFGGGVYVENGTFTMNGGEISGNTANEGGGVFVENGTFTMNGGKISSNTANGYGGGVHVGVNGIFTMNGGEISGNTADGGGGGGVYMQGSSKSSFIKIGGTITGSNSINGNVVKDGLGNIVNIKGHAVYIFYNNNGDSEKRKETTAGPGDNLYFSGGSYPTWSPTWSGAWDY